MVKQVIVVRKDLKMGVGKTAAQASHASMKIFFDRIEEIYHDARMDKPYRMNIEDITPKMKEWIEGIFTKVVVGCDDEAHLFELKKEAEKNGLPVSLVKDAGLTVFNEPTYTCIAIGPDDSDKIDEVTGELNLI